MTLGISGTGCTASECERAIEIQVPVTVAPIKAPEGPLESFTVPSPERVAEAQNHDLTDELLITMGTTQYPDTRAQAEAAATAAGGVVAGGLEEAGIYQIRWPTPQNLSAKRSILEAQPGVTAVTFSTVETYGEASAGYPIAEEFDHPEWTWPYEQVDASQAWDLATGSHVTVGVIDEGNVYAAHEDLHVVETFGPGPYSPRFHATHVAGLACAKNNNAEIGGPQLGMVGMAWGCPIVSTGIEYAKNSNAAMLRAMREMIAKPSVKIVNISMGHATNGCASVAEEVGFEQWVASEKLMFERLFAGIGKGIIWTIAAGNDCLPAAASPFAANSQLHNVITVAATNSDGNLASFSDYGPEVSLAAPGGVDTEADTKGLMSSGLAGECPFFDKCPIECNWRQTYCGDYEPDTGTSMAAPIVAGIAALVRERNPHLTAEEAGECITSTATFDGAHAAVRDLQPVYPEYKDPLYNYEESMPIVDAEAALECASGWPTKVEAPAVFDDDFHNTPQVGDTLFATSGSWTHYPTSFSYKWEDCTSPENCTSTVPAATTATYNVTPHDLGYKLRAVVTATNSAGSSQPVASHATDAVTEGGSDSGAVATNVSAGGEHTCAVLATGGIDCWGENGDGELGDGTVAGPEQCGLACSTKPVTVSGVSEAKTIAAGLVHTCALLAGGAVDCWGEGLYGALGDGSIERTSTPVAVTGLTDATAISAGEEDTCALLTTGGVDCWGENAYGQLGDGSLEGSLTPAAVAGINDATAITAGRQDTCALLATGHVDCWGSNTTGVLGDGTDTGPECGNTCSRKPVEVKGITDATAISAGWEFACALLATGGVDCWGENTYGQLGDGSQGLVDETPESSLLPVAVTGLNNATAITAGREDACALLATGGVDCWGSNASGALGDGTDTGPQYCETFTSSRPCNTSPVAVSRITDAQAITAGWEYACALLAGGRIVCWGWNGSGNLGDGTSVGPERCPAATALYPEEHCSDTPVEVLGIE